MRILAVFFLFSVASSGVGVLGCTDSHSPSGSAQDAGPSPGAARTDAIMDEADAGVYPQDIDGTDPTGIDGPTPGGFDSATPTDSGIPYPTGDIGGRPKTATKPGQIFPGLILEGLRSLATQDTPETISMAEYYDPQGLRYDLLHVIGLFMWCSHCNNETLALAKIAPWRTQHRVAVVQIAMSGYGSAAPTWTEMRKWVGDHHLDFPVLIDGQGAQLGQYFKVGSVPVNIVVNPRTMEVLAVDVGEVGDVQAYEQRFLPQP